MVNKVRIRCPGCQTLLQLSQETRGREIACPKCQKKFRVPAAALDDVPLAQPIEDTRKAVPMAQPIVPIAAPIDEVHEAVPFAAPVVPMAHAVDEPAPKAKIILSSNAPSQPQPASNDKPQAPITNAGASATKDRWIDDNDSTGYKAVKTPEPKKKPSGMTSQEENLFNTGVMLLFVPLIATVLPLINLQLKVLVAFGILAPLFGIIFGIVGAVMIVLARHRVGDQISMGVSSALLTVGFGVIGCFVGFALNPNGLNLGWENQAHDRDVADASFPGIDGLNTHSGTDTSLNNGNNSVSGNRDPNANIPGYRPPGTEIDSNRSFGPPTLSPLDGSSQSNPMATVPNSDNSKPKKEEGQPETQFKLAEGKNYPDNPGIELKQGNDESLELLAKMAKAIAAFERQSDIPGMDKKEIDVKNLVGYETGAGLLYDDVEVKALCGFAPIGYLDLIPIELTETQFSHALRPKVGEQLIGLQLSFEKEQIVGFQGVFRGGEEDTDRKTNWIGRETNDKRDSMIPDGGSWGFVVFKNGPASVGFGWVASH